MAEEAAWKHRCVVGRGTRALWTSEDCFEDVARADWKSQRIGYEPARSRLCRLCDRCLITSDEVFRVNGGGSELEDGMEMLAGEG